MPSRYAKWMYDWETRLTSVDNNRVVRPMDWGLDWTGNWPGRNGGPASQNNSDLLDYFAKFNERIIRDSDNFYSYQTPADFWLERRDVQVFSTREVPDSDIGVYVPPAPMDFSAWFEVYLGDRWWTLDARHNQPRIGRVLMATGRDAADVALTTAFGAANLKRFLVVSDEVTANEKAPA